MTRFSSIFSQLLQLFPRLEFEQAVKVHQAERSAKGFTSWGQFVAMLFCQLGRAHSLREICGGLASCEGKLKHLGVPEAPKKSTLAYANANRPWELYQTVCEQLYGKCQSVVAKLGGQKEVPIQEQVGQPGREHDRFVCGLGGFDRRRFCRIERPGASLPRHTRDAQSDAAAYARQC